MYLSFLPSHFHYNINNRQIGSHTVLQIGSCYFDHAAFYWDIIKYALLRSCPAMGKAQTTSSVCQWQWNLSTSVMGLVYQAAVRRGRVETKWKHTAFINCLYPGTSGQSLPKKIYHFHARYNHLFLSMAGCTNFKSQNLLCSQIFWWMQGTILITSAQLSRAQILRYWKESGLSKHSAYELILFLALMLFLILTIWNIGNTVIWKIL